jgi:hypothetical protein
MDFGKLIAVDKYGSKSQLKFRGFNIVYLSVSPVGKGENGFNPISVGTEPSPLSYQLMEVKFGTKMVGLNKLKSSASGILKAGILPYFFYYSQAIDH